MKDKNNGGSILGRKKGESWRDCAIRLARPHGVEEEVIEAFEDYINRGDPPEKAALCACYEWDVLLDPEAPHDEA